MAISVRQLRRGFLLLQPIAFPPGGDSLGVECSVLVSITAFAAFQFEMGGAGLEPVTSSV